jgi:hypothetical protein
MSDRTTTIAGSITGAYDETGRILYALGPNGVTRWSVETGSFLAPIPLSGQLSGIAISQDGRYLIAGSADVVVINGVRTAQMHRIDLQTLSIDKVDVAPLNSNEHGVLSVAISADGLVLFTTVSYGGWTALRSFQVDEATPVLTPVPGLPMNNSLVVGWSTLISSPDGSRILLLENGISDARSGVYDSAQGRIVSHASTSHSGYSNNDRGDVSNDGLIAIMTYGTMMVHDASLALIRDFGSNPIGRYTDAQFSHDGRHLFLFNQDSDRIELYDTTTWQLIGEADPGVDVRRVGNDDPLGALELIDNGRLMLLTTASGVRVVDLVSRLTSEATGTNGEDTLLGTVGRDTLFGLDDDDILSGGAGDDRLFGGKGDDVLTGGLGNDTINGGSGHDIVTVSGLFSDYRLLLDGDDFVLKGPDGGDQLSGVESIRFSDGRVLELNRMYGLGVDDGARGDGRIPEALLSDGSTGGDQPLVLPGLEDAGPWGPKGDGEPQVLPGVGETRAYAGLEARLSRSDDWMLTLDEESGPWSPGEPVTPGPDDPFDANGKGLDEPQVLPGNEEPALFSELLPLSPLDRDWMLTLDELSGLPAPSGRHDDWM